MLVSDLQHRHGSGGAVTLPGPRPATARHFYDVIGQKLKDHFLDVVSTPAEDSYRAPLSCALLAQTCNGVVERAVRLQLPAAQ